MPWQRKPVHRIQIRLWSKRSSQERNFIQLMQSVPSGALSDRTDGGAMENHHAAHAGAREHSREPGTIDPAIPSGKQRPLSSPSIT